MRRPILGIFLGEAAGIGPELVAKLCAQGLLHPHCRPLLIGDLRVLKLGQKIAGLDFPVQVVDDPAKASWDGPLPFWDLKNFDPSGLALGRVDPVSGKATGDGLVACLDLARQGLIQGLVFAPLNKAALQLGGYKYKSEHEMFAHYLNLTGPHGEMNVVGDIWTTRVTSHIPIKDVSANLTGDRVLEAIRLAHDTLTKAKLKAPRIAVAALNPHAGESGLCGREEIEVISPAIERAKALGINALGPYSADTIFINAFNGEYDAVTTMYHDQGQIALKLMSGLTVVTVAAGLPFPVATPAHGTAFDIAGKGLARVESTEKAVIIAARMAAGD